MRKKKEEKEEKEKVPLQPCFSSSLLSFVLCLSPFSPSPRLLQRTSGARKKSKKIVHILDQPVNHSGTCPLETDTVRFELTRAEPIGYKGGLAVGAAKRYIKAASAFSLLFSRF